MDAKELIGAQCEQIPNFQISRLLLKSDRLTLNVNSDVGSATAKFDFGRSANYNFTDDEIMLYWHQIFRSKKIERIWTSRIDTYDRDTTFRGFASTILYACDQLIVQSSKQTPIRFLSNQSEGAVTWQTYLGRARNIIHKKDDYCLFIP